MLTSCSECGTTFRISHAHLEARRGMVRCGTCGAVFNAYDTLLPEFEAPPAETDLPDAGPGFPGAAGGQDALAEVAPRDGLGSRPDASIAPDTASTARPQRPGQAAPPTATDVTGPSTAGPADTTATAAVAAYSAERIESADDILLSELPGQHKASPARRWKAFAYALLSLVLLLIFLGQAAYFLRGELVNRMPEWRPSLEAACQSIGCSIPLARDLQAVRVESSSLETDPELPAHARLHVSLSNRSRAEQAWPHVLLKLTDASNAPLAQKAFAPGEYLPPKRKPAEGLRPMSEQEILIELDMGPLSATGYEVKLLYP